MTAARSARSSGEGSLWMLSLVASLVLNALVFLAIAMIPPPERSAASTTGSSQEQVAVIELVMPQVMAEPVAAVSEPTPEPPPVTDKAVEPAPAPVEPAAAIPVLKPTFSQTTGEQTSTEAPVKAMFIGERNTRATSDQPPTPDQASPLPSQNGMPADHVETLDRQKPPDPQPDATPPAPSKPHDGVTIEQLPPGPPVTVEPAVTVEPGPLMQGPDPIAVPKPQPPPEPVPAPEPRKSAEPEQTPPSKPASQSEPSAGKTRISGSISRDGKSAVDVVDTPLGRYQATVNRLVGDEFMRNCERYQNLITSGFMTVHFVIGQDGKLGKELTVTEEVDCTIQQKGFTLQAIRSAKFPPLPPELRKKLGREPLDLTITFNF
ncbi:hypothetical protein ACFQ5Q_00100 [Luteolibacter ambystomatis]